MRAFEPHGPDSRPRGSGNHQSYQTAFRGSLGVLANPPDMHGAANGGCRDAVLAGARHSPFERKHGRELPEAAAGIDQGSRSAIPDQHRARGRPQCALFDLLRVSRRLDHAVRVMSGEIRTDQVARNFCRDIIRRSQARN